MLFVWYFFLLFKKVLYLFSFKINNLATLNQIYIYNEAIKNN